MARPLPYRGGGPVRAYGPAGKRSAPCAANCCFRRRLIVGGTPIFLKKQQSKNLDHESISRGYQLTEDQPKWTLHTPPAC